MYHSVMRYDRRIGESCDIAGVLLQVTRGRRPAKQDIAHVTLLAGARGWNCIYAEAECGEQVPEIVGAQRRLPDADVIAEAVGSAVAAGSDVRDEVAPESDHVVFVVPIAAVFERKPDFSGADVGRQGRVGKRVIVVPDLHLLNFPEVVAAIERDHLDVRLLEIVVRPRAPRKP